MRTTAQRRTRHLPGLDGLRGLAAIAIVVLHVWMYTGPDDRGGIVDAVAGELRLGVVVFFVLSAFLLVRPWLAAADRRQPLPRARTFMLRRAARILPGYWLAMIGAFTLLRDAGSGRAAAAGQLPLFAVLVQFQSDAARRLLVPQAWSLAVELSFYAILPLAGYVLVRLARARGPHTAALALAGSLIIAGLVWRLLAVTGGWPPTTTTTLPTYLPVFGCGIAVAAIAPPRSAAVRRGLLASGWLLVVLDGAWHSQGTGLTGHVVGDLPAAAGFALVIAALAAGPAGVLERAPVKWVGTISYGLYLWHLPVLYALRAHAALPADAPVAIVVVLAPSVALAACSWYGLERPTLQWLARLRDPPLRRSRKASEPAVLDSRQ